jgi:hypothetical protein
MYNTQEHNKFIYTFIRSTEVVKSAKKTFVILLPFGFTDDISEFL